MDKILYTVQQRVWVSIKTKNTLKKRGNGNASKGARDFLDGDEPEITRKPSDVGRNELKSTLLLITPGQIKTLDKWAIAAGCVKTKGGKHKANRGLYFDLVFS